MDPVTSKSLVQTDWSLQAHVSHSIWVQGGWGPVFVLWLNMYTHMRAQTHTTPLSSPLEGTLPRKVRGSHVCMYVCVLVLFWRTKLGFIRFSLSTDPCGLGAKPGCCRALIIKLLLIFASRSNKYDPEIENLTKTKLLKSFVICLDPVHWPCLVHEYTA